MATILVVDDEQMLCDLLKEELSKYGHEVLTATGGRKGIELFTQRRPHLTLLDLHMPEISGIVVLKRIRALDPQARVIILTGGNIGVWEKQARELGVTEFLRKGVALKDLVGALGKALQQAARPMGGTGESPPNERQN
jgi:CheY-like chemotaxis protein